MKLKKRSRELNIPEVSLIPIMNLVCLLIPFLLFTASFVIYATIDVSAPRFNRPTAGPVETAESLNLLVVITDEGFRVGSSSGVLPDSCHAVDASASSGLPSIPLANNQESCSDDLGYPNVSQRRERQNLRLGPPACAYNFDRLQACVQAVKAEYPDESSIVISGEPNIGFDVLIQAMDATRGNPDEPLFPNVSLSPGVA